MARRPPQTRADLDNQSCEVPGCRHNHAPGSTPLYLHPRCHPRQGVEVEYRDGVLYVRCHVCKMRVGEFAVAPGLPVEVQPS